MTTEADATQPCAAQPADEVAGWLDETTGVGTLEFRRPPHNYFNGDAMARAVELAAELRTGGARALVLCSEGRNFSAGADFAGSGGASGSRNDIYELGIELIAQPLPMVAALQGQTIGGGVGLALVADFRIATPQSRIWLNFARIGLHHGFGLSVTLPRLVGQQRAAELLLSGRRVDGETALRLGLCDRLAPPERLRAEATACAAELAANAPLAVLAIRETLRAGLAKEAAAAMTHEQEVQLGLMRTEDFAEGVRAAGERRTPNFRGL